MSALRRPAAYPAALRVQPRAASPWHSTASFTPGRRAVQRRGWVSLVRRFHPICPAIRRFSRRDGRLDPRFLGSPLVLPPCSQTPPELRARPLRRLHTARATSNTRASGSYVISGLIHTAQALAVYASAPSVTRTTGKTRFRLAANLCRVGFAYPQGCTESFASDSSDHRLPLSPGFSWRDDVRRSIS